MSCAPRLIYIPKARFISVSSRLCGTWPAHLGFLNGQREHEDGLVCAAMLWNCFMKEPREEGA